MILQIDESFMVFYATLPCINLLHEGATSSLTSSRMFFLRGGLHVQRPLISLFRSPSLFVKRSSVSSWVKHSGSNNRGAAPQLYLVTSRCPGGTVVFFCKQVRFQTAQCANARGFVQAACFLLSALYDPPLPPAWFNKLPFDMVILSAGGWWNSEAHLGGHPKSICW